MEKLLRPKDYLLLGLSLLGDLYFYIAEPPSLAIKKARGILPADYPASNFYATTKRMYKTGEVKKIIKGGKPYLILTGLGKKTIKRKFPLLALQQKKWDGLWRVVIFDIKEKKRWLRNALRLKLTSLGFGMWQRSVYISPYNVAEDMREFLISNNLGNQAYVMVSKRLYAGNEKELAAKIWPLEKINDAYQDLIDRWEYIKKNLKHENLREKAKKVYLTYLSIIADDPFLPKELLPSPWVGETIKRYLKEWFNLLNN